MNHKMFGYLIVFLMVFSCLGNSFAYVLTTNYPTKEECNGAYRYWNDGVYYGVVTSNINFGEIYYTTDNGINMFTCANELGTIDDTISYDGKITWKSVKNKDKKYFCDSIQLFDFKNCYNSNLYYNITDGNQYLYILTIDATKGSGQFSYARIDVTDAYYISINYWDRGADRNPHIDGFVHCNETNMTTIDGKIVPGIHYAGYTKRFDNRNGDFDIKV